MKLRKILVCCILSAAVSLWTFTPSNADDKFTLIPDSRFLFGMEWGYVWLHGDMVIPAGGRPGSGSPVDTSNLGIDQTESVLVFLRGNILRNHLVQADFLSLSPSGLKRIQAPFIFQNRSYSEDTSLETKLDVSWFRLVYGYKLYAIASSFLAPRIGIHHVRLVATINGETRDEMSYSNTRRLDGTFPVIGLEARHFFPLGLDLAVELEGIHLITRGFLTLLTITGGWEVHPDVMLTLGITSRLCNWTEDNQPLNNEWSLSVIGLSGGVSFGF
jgi:hypothetical protein